MNSDLWEVLTSNPYLPSMHLYLEALLMTQRAAASGPIMTSHPTAFRQSMCQSLACSDYRGSIEDQLACRHLKHDLTASTKPRCSQGKTSSQQTLDLGQELLDMLGRQGREDCSTGEPKWPEANLSTRGLGGGARKQPTCSPGVQPDSQQQHTGMRPDPGHVQQTEGNCLAACLLEPQVLCAAGEREDGETHLANTQLFSVGKHKAVPKEVKENQQLQKRQVEALRLLLMKQGETLEAGGLVQLRGEEERLHLQELLRTEQSRSVQLVAGFERICEALKFRLSETERGSENLAGQLQALLEKYSRLRKRATSTKKQLLWEVKDKEQIQRRLEEMHRETEELAAKQRLLLEQKEDVLREFQAVAELREKALREKQAVEKEASTLRSKVGRLTQEVTQTQRECKRLAKSARFRDLEREAGLKTLEELQDTVKRLYAKLEHCSTEKQTVKEEMEALKQETKSLVNQQRVELLQLQEEQRGCAEREESLRRESSALAKLVSDLKQDKLEHISALQQERARAEAKYAEEGERLRATICALKNERQLLLAEMEVLRKDYVALSDRIVQRMAQVGTEEGPMSITEMACIRHANMQQSELEHTHTAGPVMTHDGRTQIRKEFEVEKQHTRKC